MKRAITFLSLTVVLSSMGLSSKAYALANASFEGTHFTGSGRCAECHDDLTDTQGKDISIVENWSSSMMANSTRDPYWRAKVASELHRNPNLSDEIPFCFLISLSLFNVSFVISILFMILIETFIIKSSFETNRVDKFYFSFHNETIRRLMNGNSQRD